MKAACGKKLTPATTPQHLSSSLSVTTGSLPALPATPRAVHIYALNATGYPDYSSYTVLNAPDDIENVTVPSSASGWGRVLSFDHDRLVIGAYGTRVTSPETGYSRTKGGFFIYEYIDAAWTLTGTIVPGYSTYVENNAYLYQMVAGNDTIYCYWDSGPGIRVSNSTGGELAIIKFDTDLYEWPSYYQPRLYLDADIGFLAFADWNTNMVSRPSNKAGRVHINVQDPVHPVHVQTLYPKVDWGDVDFGYVASMKDGRLVVGAYKEPTQGGMSGGRVYVYINNGERYEEAFTYAPDASDNMGYMVGVSSDQLFVSAGTAMERTFEVYDWSSCVPGEYESATTGLCAPCPAGTYSGQDGPCLPCPRGTYQPSVGQSACLAPDDGYYVMPNAPEAQLSCPAGYVTHPDGWTCYDGSFDISLDDDTASYVVDSPTYSALTPSYLYLRTSQSPYLHMFTSDGTYIGSGGESYYSKSRMAATDNFIFLVDTNDEIVVLDRRGHSGAGFTEYATIELPEQMVEPRAISFENEDVLVVGLPSLSANDIDDTGGALIVKISTNGGDDVVSQIDGTTSGDNLGYHTAIDESRIYLHNLGNKRVDIYDYDTNLLGSMNTHPSTSTGSGTSLASNGTHLFIGSSRDNQVWVYEATDYSATDPLRIVSDDQQLNPFGIIDTAHSGSIFGSKIAACGDKLIIGDYWDSAENESVGAVNIYAFNHETGNYKLYWQVTGKYYNDMLGNAGPLQCVGNLFYAGHTKHASDVSVGYVEAKLLNTTCLPGTQLANSGECVACAVEERTYSPLGSSMCLEVSPGYIYTDTVSQTPCQSGSYQPDAGQTSCLYANRGFYVPFAGSTAQSMCPRGSYSSSSGSTECTVADPGYYVVHADRTQQLVCDGGKYQDEAGQPSCKLAAAGHYTLDDDQPHDTMVACDIGTYQPDPGQISCLNASIGYVVSVTGATNQTACSASGSYVSTTGASSCNTASAGFYVDDDDHTRQLVCDRGMYQPNEGQNYCEPARLGHYVPADGKPHATDLECDLGTFSNETGLTTCYQAETGYYVNSKGQEHQQSCASYGVGTYSSGSGASSCQQSEPGHYVAGSDNTRQVNCSLGSYQPHSGTASCLEADAGFFVDTVGSETQEPCASGQYSSTKGQSTCTKADVGYYVADTNRTKQQPCDDGKFSHTEGVSSCTGAGPGYYVPADGKPHTTPMLCNDGKYQPNSGQSGCLTAEAGHYVLADEQPHSSQAACLAGTYQSETGHSSCNEAQPGFYAAGDGATEEEPCDSGHFSADSGSDSCEAATPGYYVDEMDKTAQRVCDNGQYQPESGQSSCSTATAGHYVPADNQPHTSELDCSQGHYQPSTGQSTCVAASVGHYVSGTAANAQVECESGKFQNETGQTSCYTAEAGYYVSNSDYSHQKPCDGGFYQDATGQTSCKECVDKSSTPNDGQPHAVCVRWLDETVSVNSTTRMTMKTAVMNSTVSTVTMDVGGKTAPCVLVESGDSTEVVLVADTASVPAGTYSLAVTMEDGQTTTTTVVLDSAYAVPSQGSPVLSGLNGGGAVSTSLICPARMDAGVFGVRPLTRARMTKRGIECVAESTVTVDFIKSKLKPTLSLVTLYPSIHALPPSSADTEVESFTPLCLSLDADLTSTADLEFVVDGTNVTSLHVSNGKVCTGYPLSFNSTVLEPGVDTYVLLDGVKLIEVEEDNSLTTGHIVTIVSISVLVFFVTSMLVVSVVVAVIVGKHARVRMKKRLLSPHV
ncbi:CEGP1 protein [Carpediemonas membranifera]|uniref:CEGP1 protein n=1 Tax=Carpediemonas membranifera TaxID=201153 RepID=A0A8J6E0I0_9EUKA|nr:CEGP1 protein [Carpediemonas membranifera]|eukprot:KAG9392258.1 CEGP1 protein [Carpediemonas membranifera]